MTSKDIMEKIKFKWVWILICTLFLFTLLYTKFIHYDEKSCDLTELKNKVLGHRGLRGYYPENSIKGFIESLKNDLNELELDVVMTKDSQLVINHDTYINSKICESFTENMSICDLDYKTIKEISCGNMQNSNFPIQKRYKYSIPTLSQLLDTISKLNYNNVNYYVEIKSTQLYHSKNRPSSQLLVSELIESFKSNDKLDKLIVQSFDSEIINEVSSRSDSIQTCFLVKNIWSVNRNLSKLKVDPDYYALYHRFFTKSKVEELDDMDIKSLAWTVNRFDHMKRLSCIGVNKIMSDYPFLKYEHQTPVHNIR